MSRKVLVSKREEVGADGTVVLVKVWRVEHLALEEGKVVVRESYEVEEREVISYGK